MITYNLENYLNILKEYPKTSLNPEVLKNYDNLLEKLNINKLVLNTESDTKKTKRYKLNKKSEDLLSSDKVVIFKERVITEKEDIDKVKDIIKGCLNKLTTKNYAQQKEVMVNILNDNSDKESILEFFSINFFDIISRNRFYSELYSELFNELHILYPVLDKHKKMFMRSCLENIYNINYVDENVNYEGFCKNNKKNDMRRSMNIFLMNLLKKSLVDSDEVLELVSRIKEQISENRDIENKSYLIEELTENLFIFISESNDTMKKHDEWNNIIDFVKEYSKYKSKDFSSITNRIIFKYMDMVDLLNK